ncbi:MAG: hypothetical protein BJBARM5_1038 [Candidatus Parvarchaeum acidophilus ARMAN-5]|jgi:predicted amidophosphoribosyltransferase|uniref:Uncharacterized protein n=1 Tax=Candidatus Parvarchaeum acidophilus ARMAN-5 TaxID=662762 RepID=D6GX14_PARA5|nr:MAG: hypothetical protein BJBARM5_1038 [Candidatus Parvarchaeum acidophilus ARMAN-5]
MEGNSKFNVICPNCGAGAYLIGDAEEMICPNCKKPFKVSEGKKRLKEMRL